LDETQNLESNPTNGPTPPTADPGSNTDASNNGPLAMTIPPTHVNQKTEASNFSHNTSAKVGSETAAIASIDRLALDFLAKEYDLPEWDRSNILVPQHRVLPRIFAELAAGKKSTGIELLAGLQVPYRTWNIEVGLGLRTQYQSAEDYTLEIPSTTLPDFVDDHTFNYSRKLDFVAPIRLRKRLKNHTIFAGLKFIKNLSNTLEINSSIASEEYNLSKPIDQITYRNQLTILNNYTSDVRTNQGIISYSDWNLETSVGYEYQFGKCALGAALSKQIVPDFQLRSNESNKTLLESKPDLSLAIHLKYYI
jgi:hypothetical protein